ncbi:MAG TPA: hypothetical protein VL282_04430 [Tepidisphaeraceae bacterium]|jgi:hypothetical protein|nr:hypothetical protein [Tepidisphaeraceae bacterium]
MGRIGLLELLFLAIVGFAIFVLVKHFSARRRIDVPGFTLAALPDGPGTYHVIGVDRTTREDKEITLDAASSQNAKVKAELDGIVVTEVRRVS